MGWNGFPNPQARPIKVHLARKLLTKDICVLSDYLYNLDKIRPNEFQRGTPTVKFIEAGGGTNADD
jgi:hypothetical protein